jgi:hypothetical protein
MRFEQEVLTLQELVPRININTLVCGELTAEERQLMIRDCPHALLSTPAQSLRRTAFLAELAWRNWHDGQVDDPPRRQLPIYITTNQSPNIETDKNSSGQTVLLDG